MSDKMFSTLIKVLFVSIIGLFAALCVYAMVELIDSYVPPSCADYSGATVDFLPVRCMSYYGLTKVD